MKQVKYLIWLVSAVAVLLYLPSTQAQYFGLSPAEVRIDSLSPGGKAEFELILHNQHDEAYTFTLSTYQPRDEERTKGRAEFPDQGWISFSPGVIEVGAKSKATTKVTVVIPSNRKWAGEDWEIWLSASPESSDLLTVKLYVRLLLSTSGAAPSTPNIGLVVGVTAAVALIAWGIRRFRYNEAGE